jgi:hypothetical protein
MSFTGDSTEVIDNARVRLRYDMLFYAACFLFLYLHLFAFPATPFYYEQDHVNLLNDAKRMVEGEFIYRDFFEFLFPAAHIFYAGLLYVFGPRYVILNLVIIAHGMIAAYMGVQISRRLFSDTFTAYLPSALFIFFGFRWFGLDGEHRMLSPLFIYLAILILIPSRSVFRIAAAAVSCAMATLFTNQRGFLAAAAFGLMLLIEFGFIERNWSRFFKLSVTFIAAFAATITLFLLPFIATAGWDRFFQDTVLFLLSYAQDPETNSLHTYFLTITKILSLGNVVTVLTLFYTLLIPFVYLVGVIVVVIRGRRRSGWDLAVLSICLVGLFSVGTTGPNVMRLYQVSLPALIVFVWLLFKSRLLTPTFARYAVLGLAIFGLLLAGRLQTAWDTRVLDTASGRLVFLSPVIGERYEWLLQHTRPGDVVYETYNSHVNFPLGLRNPSRMSILLNSDYSPPEHVAWAIEDLKRLPPKYIIWDGAWTPEMSQLADGERLKPFYNFMTANYHRVVGFTPYDGREREIWERIVPEVQQ